MPSVAASSSTKRVSSSRSGALLEDLLEQLRVAAAAVPDPVRRVVQGERVGDPARAAVVVGEPLGQLRVVGVGRVRQALAGVDLERVVQQRQQPQVGAKRVIGRDRLEHHRHVAADRAFGMAVPGVPPRPAALELRVLQQPLLELGFRHEPFDHDMGFQRTLIFATTSESLESPTVLLEMTLPVALRYLPAPPIRVSPLKISSALP